MGCFFGCFRVKDRDRHHAQLVSDVVSSRSKEPLIKHNRLAALLYGTEQHTRGSPLPPDGKSSLAKNSVRPSLQSTDTIDGDSDHRELRNEVKFLKSCGTLQETPTEIREASKRVFSPHDGDAAASKFHSWLPTMSCRKLHLGEQHDQLPSSSATVYGEFGKASFPESSGSPKHVSGSCRSDESTSTRRNLNQLLKENSFERMGNPMESEVPSNDAGNILPHTSRDQIATTQYQNKYVQFECAEHSSSKIDSQSCKQSDSPDFQIKKTLVPRLDHSPYPTPLKVTDQMQTPGTVYPTNLENVAIGKNARMRSQYVYPVLNVVENLAQWKALKGDSEAHQLVDSEEFLERCEKASPERPESGKKCQSVGDSVEHNDSKSAFSVDSSLSHWLKPVLPNDPSGRAHSARCYDSDRPILGTVATYWNDELSQTSPRWRGGNGKPNSINDARSWNTLALSNERSHSGKSSDSDRPILGTVAAHWSDEQSQISPKWWDGNGIPNSTNKYKEDQKVSWHATPFEERLEKALSDEKLLPQRKPDFDESEERDTAASGFSATTHGSSILVGGI